uniref:unspecific monooxygenase n=1 Tax=Conogethes punctiferalis TaxID=1133088 RepID=A0A7S7ADA9_CONPF|nr:cytochrome P450 monooxygenase CYP9G18 [Conogethes punctiferalis]
MLLEILIFLLPSLVAYYLYVYKKIHYKFQEHGVKFLPGLPLFGNTIKSTFLKNHIIQDLDIVYKAFPEERYVGYIELTTPIIVIRDPELIKQITVKDFDHFVNHREFFTEDLEPLFGASLLMMKGDRWRDMRTTLSPAFTGSKMRLMMPFMTEISKNIVEDLRDRVNKDLDLEDVMRRYTNDVIASAAFGLQVNSLKDRDNQFFLKGTEFVQLSQDYKDVFSLVAAMFPNFLKMLNVQLFPKATMNFFRDIVSNTMEQREKHNIVRPDMIQLLMEAVKGTLNANSATEKEKDVGFATVHEEMKHNAVTREWTQNELAGQVFIFFAAGFDTSSSTMTFLLHELTINPDIQEKLYQEIKEFEETRKSLTYDNIGQLKYLDCVLNELLRKWSAAIVMDREVTKSYELPPPHEGGKPYKLNPGDIIYNVVNSIHMDPKYYPEPDVFNPERFSEENKHNIKPFTFMPFGIGPRACIGTRFALLEMKVLVYYIILNYKLLKSAKTQDPVKLKPMDFNLRVYDGSWVKLEARN